MITRWKGRRLQRALGAELRACSTRGETRSRTSDRAGRACPQNCQNKNQQHQASQSLSPWPVSSWCQKLVMEVPTPPSGSKSSTRPSAPSTIGKIKIVQVEEVRKPVSSAGAIVLQSMRKSVGVHSFGNKKKS